MIHACTIGSNCLVGMGATVLDGAKVPHDSCLSCLDVSPAKAKDCPHYCLLRELFCRNTSLPASRHWYYRAGVPNLELGVLFYSCAGDSRIDRCSWGACDSGHCRTQR